MHRRLIAIALAATASVFCAASAPTTVERAFGNTIVSTYPDGRTAELWLQPGGAYTAKGRRGDTSNGHWKLKGERLCLKQSHPLPVPFSFCTPLPPAGQKTTWSAKAATGEPIHVKLVKGHVGRA